METRRIITAFTSARHLSLYWASSIQSIGHTKASIQARGKCLCFVTKPVFNGEELSTPRPIPKLEDHPLSAVHDYLFNIYAATLHIGGRSSVHNLRTRHAMVTGWPITDCLLLLIRFVWRQCGAVCIVIVLLFGRSGFQVPAQETDSHFSI